MTENQRQNWMRLATMTGRRTFVAQSALFAAPVHVEWQPSLITLQQMDGLQPGPGEYNAFMDIMKGCIRSWSLQGYRCPAELTLLPAPIYQAIIREFLHDLNQACEEVMAK